MVLGVGISTISIAQQKKVIIFSALPVVFKEHCPLKAVQSLCNWVSLRFDDFLVKGLLGLLPAGGGPDWIRTSDPALIKRML